ncbi:ATP12 protein-related [Striga hermonthica]|uniref:ATP12 protein-related n=1 Tax=Striga hermonthica TaxID=68872 RepID=A0A9N7R8B3_STRHE|nr:ATP12 protein-related [Striga hermonthica]
MASSMVTKTLKTLNRYALTALTSTNRQLSVSPASRKSEDDAASCTFSSGGHDRSKHSETLKTPWKRNLKCPTLALAKAIAAEWEYQQSDGIRPFTMPLMKLACTALERVPNPGLSPLCTQVFSAGNRRRVWVEAVENVLKKTDDCELVAIDAIASAAHSLKQLAFFAVS